MTYHLVCNVPVGDYQRGSVVRDPAEVARLMGSHDAHFVRIAVPDEPSSPELPTSATLPPNNLKS